MKEKELNNKKEICTLPNGKKLVFYRGRFDDYCVAVVRSDGKVYTPLDKDYFASLKRYGEIFGNERTNKLFLRIYTFVEKEMSFPRNEHFDRILKNVTEYVGDRDEYIEEVYETMCILYVAMIAEENHRYNGKVYVGKDVKKTGVHLLLIDGYSPEYAADVLKGMKWREIKRLSEQHNIKVGLPRKYWRAS